MSRAKLSDEVIAARMVEWRNLKKAHERDRARISKLKAENKELRAMVELLREQNQAQAIQIAELQTMVFGKKKSSVLPPGGTPVSPLSSPPAEPRSKQSYSRPTPPASAITQVVAVPLPSACRCGGVFDPATISTYERYEEDIPLPRVTPGYQAKIVTKYEIERGICASCHKAISGHGLGGAQVTLGSNLRLLVTHLVVMSGLSYAQAGDLVRCLYDLAISDGEIAAILKAQHKRWLPAYEHLKADIRAAPVLHVDETPWPIQELEGRGYAWALADASSPRVVYDLAQSRGVSVIKTLLGQGTKTSFTGVRVSDDYGAYHSSELPGSQQLCWVHLYRSIRDLKDNGNVPEEQQPYVKAWYSGFAAIYQSLKTQLEKPFDEATRQAEKLALWQQLKTLAEQPPPTVSEPVKLTRLKAQVLRAGPDRLLRCLTNDIPTPCDNNRAERDLRQLVLKRKRSFGSKTQNGAQALATLLSLCTTTWRTTPSADYFRGLAGV